MLVTAFARPTSSLAYGAGLALGQVAVSAILAAPPTLAWYFYWRKRQTFTPTRLSNVFFLTTAGIFLLVFIALRSLVAGWMPALIDGAAAPQTTSQTVPPTDPEVVTVTLWGVQSCGRWTDVRSSKSSRFGEAWLQGYLSAYAVTEASDVLHNTDASSVFYRMDVFCKENPLSDISDGAKQIIQELQLRRGK